MKKGKENKMGKKHTHNFLYKTRQQKSKQKINNALQQNKTIIEKKRKCQNKRIGRSKRKQNGEKTHNIIYKLRQQKINKKMILYSNTRQ